MKKTIFLLLIDLFLAFFISNTNAQWVQTGPTGGWIYDYAVSGNTIYAASYGGILVSSNGIDWTHTNWGLMEGDVESVIATSTKVYAGTWGDGLYMKDISGGIWEHCSMPVNSSVQCLAAIGDNVFAGTYGSGVYRSTDNGSTWDQVNNGLTASQVECFAVSGTDIYAGIEGGGVFRSTDNGANWTAVNNGLPSDSPISLAVNGTKIYVGLWDSGIWATTNNGQGWLSYGQPVNYPSSFAFNGSDVYVCGGVNGVYLTTNDGTDWTKLDNGISASAQIRKIKFLGNTFVAGEATVNEESRGMYVSTNYGSDWTQINWGLPKYCIYGIAVSNGNIFTATSGGIYRSTNEGVDWNKPTIHGDYNWADFTAIGFINNNNGIAGDVNGYSYNTTSGGVDWNTNTKIEDGTSVTSFAFISTNIFASTKPFASGVEGGVYLSSDNGTNWLRVSTGLPTLADTNTVVSCLAVLGTNLFAGTGHGVYLSTNNGTNWTKASTGLPEPLIYSLIVNGSEILAGTSSHGVYHSIDNGSNWTMVGKDTLHNPIDVTALISVDTNLFAGTSFSGSYRLVNDSTWRFVGLSGKNITAFTVLNDYMYASTANNSVWSNSISMLTDVRETNDNIPKKFALSQNYPNPFNPSTKINFQIEKSGLVILKVYDVLGREIATLVNEVKHAGSYEVNFDANNLTSGIYFYRIQTGNYCETKKMILLK